VSDPYNALNATLYTALSSRAALGTLLAGTAAVYFEQAPDDATLPYVVYSCAGMPHGPIWPARSAAR
jgi:hypothetical protein